jgi:hypothetical protein
VIIEKRKRRVFHSDEERKLARSEKNLRMRANRAAKGMCLSCSNSVLGQNRRVCETCCRKSTVRRHTRGLHKTYQLGSKLSPERKTYTLKIVKATNEILRKNWQEISPWLEENFELFTEHYDGVLYSAIPFNMVGDVDAIQADEWLMRAYYQRIGAQATLEDFVIAKIDAEREQKCRKATPQVL